MERLASLALLLALSPASAASAGAALRVVTTTTDLASLAKAVGGDRVAVDSIATGTQDPHFVEARPSFIMKARSADLFVSVGMELEAAWEPSILDGARNARIRRGQPGHLDASEGVSRIEVPAGTIDRSMGDVHAAGNPHYWLDPWNARVVAASIAARLSELSPGDAAGFAGRLATFRARLDAAMFGAELARTAGGELLWQHELGGDLAAWLGAEGARRGWPPLGGWAGRMAPHRGRHVLTYHRSWSYFLARFGLVSAGEIEPKPGIPPTPGHLARLVETARARNAGAILVEPFYSDRAPRLVASRTGAIVLSLPLSVASADSDYVEHVDALVAAVDAALSGGPRP